jgi:hypothetical protein
MYVEGRSQKVCIIFYVVSTVKYVLYLAVGIPELFQIFQYYSYEMAR